ncbi:uncharacterized protein LOC120632529 isoform X2 [Pararge aegeria]|uniref:uncharacterized protein LOC120632529 isoform X2 n=1 Tax=Pararge aegeria TaxID=116150 RepID=UPI0019D1E376|nr:uncharacterized protein LOC120632529 isoform X2 [Pararge aegeria]
MLMASALTTLLAVLCGAVAGAGDVMGNASRVRRAPHAHRVLTDEELDATAAWKRSHWREMQTILRKEGSNRDVECCPSIPEMVAKKGGRTPTGLYVELYEDGENKQRLYELSCAPGVVDKPCRFVDARLYNQSKCVQKYSYSYALVRYSSATEMPLGHRPEGHFSVPGSGGWSMDYVIVRAGCECQITPPKRKSAHRKRMERHRQRKRNRRLEEDDDT